MQELKKENVVEVEKQKQEMELSDSKTLPNPLNTSNYFYSPQNTSVILARSTAKCVPLKDKKQWFVLFGSIPVNKVRPEELFDTSGSYRVYLKSTVTDIIASLFLGLVTTITVKTVFVENCNSNSGQ